MRPIYPEIADLGTILGIWAHPDDESWSAAGITAAARANGQRVVCITATRGEQGIQDESRWPSSQLAHIREQEMAASLAILDIKEHHWLNYQDGECATIPMTSALAKIEPIIADVKPDTILTFGAEGLTGHVDHKAVNRWTHQAVANLPAKSRPAIYHVAVLDDWYIRLGQDWQDQFNIFFNIDQPPLVSTDQADLLYMLPEELITKKLEALRAQPSQMEGMFTAIPHDELHETASFELFMRG